MGNNNLNWIANFIWGIADDVLRDLYVRGKYRDVVLPMTVLRRIDSLLESTKQVVLEMKASLDKAGIVHQDQALRQAAGQAFYNTSKFTLRDLKARASQQQLKADFEAYLDGFSPNVQDILEKFEFRNQIPRLSRADALGTLNSGGWTRLTIGTFKRTALKGRVGSEGFVREAKEKLGVKAIWRKKAGEADFKSYESQ
jgi:type I restriction enzyme M protein